MADAEEGFPPGSSTRWRSTPPLPIVEGMHEIVKTLFEAMVLVIIVVFIFLQSWRATLIPLLAVPVSLVGDLRGLPAARLLAQHALALRAHPGHRPRGGRRDRGGGGGGAPHREGALAARRDAEGDAGGDRAGHRHRAGALLGVHPGGLHPRDHRPALPAVRADHRHLGADLGLQCADVEPGALGDAAEVEARPDRPDGPVREMVQRPVRPDDRRVREDQRRAGPEDGPLAGPAPGGRADRRLHGLADPHRIRAQRGPGLRARRHPAPRRRLAATDAGSGEEAGGDPGQDPGHPELHRGQRLQHPHRHCLELPGDGVHRLPQWAERKHENESAAGIVRAAEHRLLPDSGGAGLRVPAAGHPGHRHRGRGRT